MSAAGKSFGRTVPSAARDKKSEDNEMVPLCFMLGHHRSAKRAKFNFEAQRWESVCSNCGVQMIRIEHRQWRLKSAADELSQTEYV